MASYKITFGPKKGATGNRRSVDADGASEAAAVQAAIAKLQARAKTGDDRRFIAKWSGCYSIIRVATIHA